MEISFDKSLEKFMKTLGITYTIEISRGYRDTFGRKNVCYEIRVEYKEESQYIQYHCYRWDGKNMVYREGNEVMGVKDGVLAYLGENQKVDEYFDRLARVKAKDFFESDF